jgi:AraC-like DNA-binding protein
VNPVKVMADKASVTERTVQMRFKKYAGYSPKELLRFLRFKQVMAFILARPKEKIDWFELIVQYGYHDQSHLIKDFKYYTGVTPKQFIKLNEEGNLCLARD